MHFNQYVIVYLSTACKKIVLTQIEKSSRQWWKILWKIILYRSCLFNNERKCVLPKNPIKGGYSFNELVRSLWLSGLSFTLPKSKPVATFLKMTGWLTSSVGKQVVIGEKFSFYKFALNLTFTWSPLWKLSRRFLMNCGNGAIPLFKNPHYRSSARTEPYIWTISSQVGKARHTYRLLQHSIPMLSCVHHTYDKTPRSSFFIHKNGTAW